MQLINADLLLNKSVVICSICEYLRSITFEILALLLFFLPDIILGLHASEVLQDDGKA